MGAIVPKTATFSGQECKFNSMLECSQVMEHNLTFCMPVNLASWPILLSGLSSQRRVWLRKQIHLKLLSPLKASLIESLQGVWKCGVPLISTGCTIKLRQKYKSSFMFNWVRHFSWKGAWRGARPCDLVCPNWRKKNCIRIFVSVAMAMSCDKHWKKILTATLCVPTACRQFKSRCP